MTDHEPNDQIPAEPEANPVRKPWHEPKFMMTTETQISNGALTSGDDIGAGQS